LVYPIGHTLAADIPSVEDTRTVELTSQEIAVVKSDPPKRPHVLFLAVDDMRDWVGCLEGYDGAVHTPNIDRLAKRGTLFTNAHCPSPMCGPSRAAVMTGLRPSTTGLYGNDQWWLPNLTDTVVMPMHFRNHGYRAVGAGKIFHHTAGNEPPNQWDDLFSLTFRNDPWLRRDKENYPWSQSGRPPIGFPFSGVPGLSYATDWGPLDIADEEYDDARTADFTIHFLQQCQDRPFFLACGLFRPHLPWYVPQEFIDLYPLDEVRLPPVREDDLDDIPAEGQRLARARRGDFENIRDSGRWKHAVRAYLASISYADCQVGRVLDALEGSAYAGNTIIVLWSDHGWQLGEKGHWHKGTLWEAATRVPLIICAPGNHPGVCTRSVSLIDIYPTLNELCGLEHIATHDGKSLVPLLRHPSTEWNRPAVTEFLKGNAAVRSDRFRYIRYRDGGEELYDHKSDPHEWRNLADDANHTATKQELARWLPKVWAKPAPTKDAFLFDPDSFTWTDRVTGAQTNGKHDRKSTSD